MLVLSTENLDRNFSDLNKLVLDLIFNINKREISNQLSRFSYACNFIADWRHRASIKNVYLVWAKYMPSNCTSNFNNSAILAESSSTILIHSLLTGLYFVTTHILLAIQITVDDGWYRSYLCTQFLLNSIQIESIVIRDHTDRQP